MAKAHIFKKRNANRYRKIYNYIRKKPVDQFVSDSPFTMIVGEMVIAHFITGLTTEVMLIYYFHLHVSGSLNSHVMWFIFLSAQ